MAPRDGLESRQGGISPCGSTMPTPPTKWLIPPGLYQLDLLQVSPNPSFLDPSLKDHRLASVPALLAPDQPPRSSSDLGSSAQDVFRVIVLPDTALYVIRLTAIVSARNLALDNVDRMPHRVLKQQSPSQCGGAPDFHGSPGRTRTADQVVNSHPLYRLSYRGSVYTNFLNSRSMMHCQQR